MTLDEWVGTIGVTLLLIAFFANAFGYLQHETRRYQGMNAIGAALACAASLQIGFMPFVVLEGVWGLVALAALARITLRAPSSAA